MNCVLFDLDNTLLLRKPSIPEKVFETLSKELPDICYADVEHAYADSELWTGEQVRHENVTGVLMSDEEFLDNLISFYKKHLPLNEELARELIPVLSGRYEKAYAPMPGAVELLQSLSAKQVRLGIVSNNYSNIREVLISLDLLPYFDCILISEEIGISKPDPRILALACEKLNTSIENSLYVGDHPFDILCAHDAGMQIAWFPPNRYYQIPSYVSTPEYTITSLTDLLNIL